MQPQLRVSPLLSDTAVGDVLAATRAATSHERVLPCLDTARWFFCDDGEQTELLTDGIADRIGGTLHLLCDAFKSGSTMVARCRPFVC